MLCCPHRRNRNSIIYKFPHGLNDKTILSDEYSFPSQEVMLKILGPGCENLPTLQRELGVTLGQRGLSVHIKGELDLSLIHI